MARATPKSATTGCPRQQDVLWFDVAVHDALAVGVGERVRDVHRHVQRIRQGQRALLHEALPQRFPFDVRHDVVQQAADFAGREDRDDVGMVEPGGQFHFPDEPIVQQARGDVRLQHLDGHWTARMLLGRQVHQRHAPGADLAFHLISGRETLAQQLDQVGHRGPT
jgi:hypothetical protein